jgi:hypothetical protein
MKFFQNIAVTPILTFLKLDFRRTCSACVNKLMNVCLMKAQFFQMVGPARSFPNDLGVSSSGSDLPPPLPRTIAEAFMAVQTELMCQILQTQQQIAQGMQQQPLHGANLDGPNLVTKTMNSTRKDPEKPRSGVPTQADIDTIVSAITMLEEQDSVLSQIVRNIIQGRYQGLSQTSLTDDLSQSLSTSMVEQARLCNLLVDHINQDQLSTSDSLLPPSKLPMDLSKEERKSRSNK